MRARDGDLNRGAWRREGVGGATGTSCRPHVGRDAGGVGGAQGKEPPVGAGRTVSARPLRPASRGGPARPGPRTERHAPARPLRSPRGKPLSSSTPRPAPRPPPPPSPPPSAPPSPALPPLASCGALPNYFNPGGPFTRWERFPLRLSIDSASLPFAPSELFVAYVKGIREGAVVWSRASGEAFGILSEVGSNLQNADITVRVDQPVGEALLFGTEGEVELLQLGSARIIRRARILLYPSNFPPLSPPELQAYVANIVGHEMGHAFGVLQHSTDRKST